MAPSHMTQWKFAGAFLAAMPLWDSAPLPPSLPPPTGYQTRGPLRVHLPGVVGGRRLSFRLLRVPVHQRGSGKPGGRLSREPLATRTCSLMDFSFLSKTAVSLTYCYLALLSFHDCFISMCLRFPGRAFQFSLFFKNWLACSLWFSNFKMSF